MLSPVDALLKLREEAVMTRRRLVDQMDSIVSVQAEIEAIDRAIADERASQEAEHGTTLSDSGVTADPTVAPKARPIVGDYIPVHRRGG